MADHRLSPLQRRIVACLLAKAHRTRGPMAASHQELVQALAGDKGSLSHSLGNLAAKGLVRITRTASAKAEAVELTPQGHRRALRLAGSCG